MKLPGYCNVQGEMKQATGGVRSQGRSDSKHPYLEAPGKEPKATTGGMLGSTEIGAQRGPAHAKVAAKEVE